jgi:hypothetical protein
VTRDHLEISLSLTQPVYECRHVGRRRVAHRNSPVPPHSSHG